MSTDYIHGFSAAEQERLFAQARTLAPGVFKGWDLSGAASLLEIGCGVGAELAIIRERWPHIALTGLDRSASHLAAGRSRLPGDINLVEGDATSLPFPDASFDRVITIWMLEHVRDPVAVLREALRVLKPGGEVICTEVDNDTFRFNPPEEAIADWWARFNRFQEEAGGDPYVGPKLARIAQQAGAVEVAAGTAPILDTRREPEQRQAWLAYVRDLLLSGAANLRSSGYAGESEQRRLEAAFERLRGRNDFDFTYYAVRMSCKSS